MFPKEIWSSNPQERLNKEIRRRNDVVDHSENAAVVAVTVAEAGSVATPLAAEARKSYDVDGDKPVTTDDVPDADPKCR